MTPKTRVVLAALEKSAFLGSALRAGGRMLAGGGKLLASIPFYMLGSSVAESLVGKKPEVQHAYVSPQKFRQLQINQAMKQRAAGGKTPGFSGGPYG